MNQLFVISLGGSLVVPDGIDTNFLQSFKDIIENQIKDLRRRFVIVVGGGKLARRYQEAAKDLHALDDEDADWLGIHSTRLNAHLLRTVFKKYAHPKLFSAPEDVVPFSVPIAIGAGWRPGWSTDYVAVNIAEKLGARRVVNLSNTAYVYASDPRVNPEARKLPRVSWTEYRALIPAEWRPGLNTPFDPVASRKAEEIGLEVAVMNGADLANFEKYLEGEEFEGTVIK
jgi:uridylate kinase